MRKIISVLQILSIVIGISAVVLIIIPMIIGIKPYVVLSGSMEPKVKTGALIYINNKVPVEEIKVGDIIAFNIEDVQVTHRVVSINEDKSFTTKGDANTNVDFMNVNYNSYNGKAICSIPVLGRIVEALRSRTGIFIALVLIGLNLLYIIYEKILEHKKMKLNQDI